MATYDRSTLRAAAARVGIENANQLARKIGCGRQTAYRLWRGEGAPSAEMTAAVHRICCVSPADLLVPAPAEPAA